MHNQLQIDISKHDENAEPCHLNQRYFPILLQQAIQRSSNAEVLFHRSYEQNSVYQRN